MAGKKVFTYKVMTSQPQTIIGCAAKAFPVLGSPTAVKKAIRQQQLTLNRRRATVQDKVQKGDFLQLTLASKQKSKKKLQQKIPVLFEDDYLLIVNKPAGIAVNGNRHKTLENALQNTIAPSSLPDALPSPVALHRIDVPTRGLVLLAKTKTAQIRGSRLFQQRKIHKTYLAVVHGKPASKGQINEPIGGKKAVTDYELLRSVPSQIFGHLSLLKLHPLTGRTHQLRIHLNNRGHLIVGDKKYAEQKTILGKGLYLCAAGLQFAHPVTRQPIGVSIDPPRRFLRLLEREQQRFG